MELSFLQYWLIYFCTSCSKDIVSSGNVIISVDNQSLYSQSDYSVRVDIVFFESDTRSLVSLGRSDISEGRMVKFAPIDLNVGNYYVRYQYFLGTSTSGGQQHRPFQIRAGEDTVVRIIL